jgi:hypothetical protein
MAVTVTTRNNGARNLIVELDIAADNTDAVVVDVSALSISLGKLSLVEAQWALTGAPATLEWDQTSDALLLEMTTGNGFMLFDNGSRKDPAGAGTTGDVVLTNAVGLVSGTVLLKFRKQ